MEKKNNNAEIDFNELERLAKCGGSDYSGSVVKTKI